MWTKGFTLWQMHVPFPLHFAGRLYSIDLGTVYPRPQEAGPLCSRLFGRCACPVSAVKAVRGPRGKASMPSGTMSGASVPTAAGSMTRVRARGNRHPKGALLHSVQCTIKAYTWIHIKDGISASPFKQLMHTEWTVTVCFVRFLWLRNFYVGK